MRHYLRRPGHKAISLPGSPGAPAFMAAYQAALEATEQAATPGASRTTPGSLDALAVSYYRSAGYAALRESTQVNYRRIVERLRAKHGSKPVAALDARGVKTLTAERQAHPAAANHLLRMLRLLMAHAAELGWRETDPTAGIKRQKHRTKGLEPWGDADIAAYEEHHPPGTRPRLALALLLYTGQRRSDVVRMGWQHVRDGKLEVRQVKTGTRALIPIHPLLAAELDHVGRDRLCFLMTEAGKPFTPNGFYMRFRGEWCEAAGIRKGLGPHGLRKATGRRLVEAGCKPWEVGSILGHKSLGEMQKYTADFDREKLAERAMGRIVNLPSQTGLQTRPRKRVISDR